MGIFDGMNKFLKKVINSEELNELKGTLTKLNSEETENEKKENNNCPSCGANAEGKVCKYCGQILSLDEKENSCEEDGNYAIVVFLEDCGFMAEDVVNGIQTDVYPTAEECLNEIKEILEETAKENASNFKLVTKNEVETHKRVQKFKEKGYKFKIKTINIKTFEDDINW